jgi:hypothetical protein
LGVLHKINHLLRDESKRSGSIPALVPKIFGVIGFAVPK